MCQRKFHPQKNVWVLYDRYFIVELFEKYELHNVSIIKKNSEMKQ